MRPGLPATIADAMAYWGPRWATEPAAGRDAMVAAWTPLLRAGAQRAFPALTVRQNVPYGPHPRQILDVVIPRDALEGEPLPVLVFVHGGAFIRGTKAETAELYGNVTRTFASHGYVAVNVEYRLAPEVTWPRCAQDVIAALEWVRAHIGEVGGNPDSVFLMGHSAGCAHCATAVWDDRVGAASRPSVKGMLLISPRIDADVRPSNHNAHGVRAYYGPDADHADRVPIHRVRPDAPPTFVAWAEFENPGLDVEAASLVVRLLQHAEAGGPVPRVVQMMGHNHTSIITQCDTPFDALGAECRSWMETVLSSTARREQG